MKGGKRHLWHWPCFVQTSESDRAMGINNRESERFLFVSTFSMKRRALCGPALNDSCALSIPGSSWKCKTAHWMMILILISFLSDCERISVPSLESVRQLLLGSVYANSGRVEAAKRAYRSVYRHRKWSKKPKLIFPVPNDISRS